MESFKSSSIVLLVFLMGCMAPADGKSLPCLSKTASVVGVSDAAVTVEGDVKVSGAMVLLGKSTLQLQRGLDIEAVVVGSTPDQLIGGARETIRRHLQVDITPREAALLAHARLLSAFTPDEVFDSLENSHLFLGNGGVKVIQVSGDVALSGNSALKFAGSASDVFVVQVGGNLSISGTAGIQVTGGVSANSVIFILNREDATLQLSASAAVEATLMAPHGTAQLSGQAHLRGALIAWDSIRLSGSGVSVTPAPFCPMGEASKTEGPTPVLAL